MLSDCHSKHLLQQKTVPNKTKRLAEHIWTTRYLIAYQTRITTCSRCCQTVLSLSAESLGLSQSHLVWGSTQKLIEIWDYDLKKPYLIHPKPYLIHPDTTWYKNDILNPPDMEHPCLFLAPSNPPPGLGWKIPSYPASISVGRNHSSKASFCTWWCHPNDKNSNNC